MKKWTLFLLLAAAVTSQAGQDIRGAWGLDDGTGVDVADSSGNDNHGVARNVKWDPGAKHACLLFNEKGTIEVANAKSLNPEKELTVEAWIRVWGPKYEQYPTIISKKGSYELRLAPGGKLSMLLNLDGKDVELTSKKSSWNNSVWYYVAGTYDGETMTLYVDGKKDAEMAAEGKIAASDSKLCFGSIDGKAKIPGRLDEIRIAGKAFSADEIFKSFDAIDFEVSREHDQFSAWFQKKDKRTAEAVVPGTLWIDAEDFDEYGGWIMDTQFVPQMGSPYLMANGLGQPVDDAVTMVNVPEAGEYTLWVRSKNWLKDHAPGKFKVTLNDVESKTVFGAEKSGRWVWENGGTIKLEAGETLLSMTDLTGFYGRCDAIILTTDAGYQPVQEQDGYKVERARLTGESTEAKFVDDYDVIVVGAGVAGINAAISSARTGAKTALIQDRPMIGGNNSLELGVVVSGPAHHGKPNARESGLNEEIGRVRSYHFHGKWSQGAELVATEEPNLTIHLNTHVNEVEKDGSRITAVKAFNMVDGKRTRYTAKQFIDCTGDGWLGYYAGAEYRLGREASSEFNESNAPEKADNITMSGCLMTGHTLCYNTKKMATPQSYTGPEWLWDLTPNGKNIEARNDYKGSHTYGRWWHENVGETDDLWDPENARDELIILNLSYWNWIKNHSSLKGESENLKLTIIPTGNAKRETRRLVGDHILTQSDVLDAVEFEDRIATGGWSLDIHHPKGIFSEEGPFDFNTHSPVNYIPFRILYSKNIDNLLFAGRQVSTTHVALGNVRVQATTGVMGQAVGTAAAMCVDMKTNPRGLYQNHIGELQQQLLKDDQFILGVKNEDAEDLALSAKVTASSFIEGCGPEGVISGVSRIVGDVKNMWVSDPEQALPQWLELDFGKARKMNAIYLTFDTELNYKFHTTWEHKETERFVPESVRNYEVQVLKGKKWVTVADVKDNYQRRRIHRFKSLKVSKIKVIVTQTNGDKSARIFEVRAYNE